MNSKAEERITIAWWNTSLAPSAVGRSDSTQLDIACSVIIYLIRVTGADFIALGEMSTEDLLYISDKCKVDGYTFANGISKAGRSSFDICYVYNSTKIYIFSSKDITSDRGGSTLKVAKKLEVVIGDSKSIFHFYISHWPSRLWCEEHSAKRHLLGIRLRDNIENVMSSEAESPFIVLLGDYNDEPFNESMSQQLMASRDIELVSRRQHLLYNPFWRYLSKASIESPVSGSYYYKSGEFTRWHTFDQIIFSHAFVADKEWRLDENCQHILEFPDYTKLVQNSSSKFDHLPVIGIIERVI